MDTEIGTTDEGYDTEESATLGVSVKRLVSREVCERAVNHYGHKEQAGQAMEECGELITALHKYFYRSGNFNHMRLAEEIADVMIMCEQLNIILEKQGYGEMVEHAKIYKLQRLNRNIATDIIVG